MNLRFRDIIKFAILHKSPETLRKIIHHDKIRDVVRLFMFMDNALVAFTSLQCVIGELKFYFCWFIL